MIYLKIGVTDRKKEKIFALFLEYILLQCHRKTIKLVSKTLMSMLAFFKDIDIQSMSESFKDIDIHISVF